MKKKELIRVFPRSIRETKSVQELDFEKIQEIRFRVGQDIMIYSDKGEMVLKEKALHTIQSSDIKEMLEYMSQYSLYAYEQELRQGFITLEGGHRVGMAGKVITESNRVKNFKHISSINIRVAHEVIGCAEALVPHITRNKMVCHTLIISPPKCGKTTLLRDLIRLVSDGNEWVKGSVVGVVDERSEIGACYRGVIQNNIGRRTDVLDACPKAEGMIMLIRSMAPQIIAVDEIGTTEDMYAIEYAMLCGCKLLATVHGNSLEDVRNKPILGNLMKERRFERYVLMGGEHKVGEVMEIYDERGSIIFQNSR